MALILGDDNDNNLNGTPENDEIRGSSGNDTVTFADTLQLDGNSTFYVYIAID